jgi:spore coat protein U-like protein
MRQALASLLFALAWLAPTPAAAICVLCSCTVTADPLNFGNLDPFDGADLDMATNVDVSCTGLLGSVVNNMTISLGGGANGTVSARRMRNDDGDLLTYNLFADAGRNTIWGDGTGGFDPVEVENRFSVLSWNTTTPVYGRIFAAPMAQPGHYTDTIIVTVEW